MTIRRSASALLLGSLLASAVPPVLVAMPARHAPAAGTVVRAVARGGAARARKVETAGGGDSTATRDGVAPGHAAAGSVGRAATYIDDVIAGGGARLKRWGDRTAAPVRVWIAPGEGVPGWRPAFTASVRDAFAAWASVGLPVRFTFVAAPDDAEVRVTWADRLAGRRAGETHWRADDAGWLRDARLVFAIWASDGTPADAASVRRIALHEIGHALGLEHSPDPDDVMAEWVRAGALSGRDRATAQLLYTLRPGAVAGVVAGATAH